MMDYKKLLTLAAVAAFGGIVALGFNKLIDNQDNAVLGEKQPAYFTALNGGKASELPDFTATAMAVTPTVVHIKTTINMPQQPQQQMQQNPFGELFGDKSPFFQMPHGPQQASGSGVIIADNGYIVTNNHVIDGADKIEVVLYDKRSYTAEVIGKDANTDMALIKIEEKNLPFIAFGNSDETKVGEWVLAVGNPFNLTSTVTAGIVSAKGRNIRLIEGDAPIEAFIQTDAAVNPGNSGGALVNRRGELIGINTAIASQTGSYAGYAFAVPVELVKKAVNDFKEFGEMQRGFLGIQIRDIDAELADKEGLKVNKGVYVAEVTEGSAAGKAGIEKGDIVIKINEVVVNAVSELQEQVSRHRPGEKLNVTAIRKGKEQVFTVTLKGKNGQTSIPDATAKTEKASLKGSEFSALTREEKTQAKIANGVKVLKAGDALKKVNLPAGFIITHIDGKQMFTPADVKKSLIEKKEVAVIKGVNADGTKGYYAVPLE